MEVKLGTILENTSVDDLQIISDDLQRKIVLHENRKKIRIAIASLIICWIFLGILYYFKIYHNNNFIEIISGYLIGVGTFSTVNSFLKLTFLR